VLGLRGVVARLSLGWVLVVEIGPLRVAREETLREMRWEQSRQEVCAWNSESDQCSEYCRSTVFR
jgi:hypothetical protein